MQWGEFEVAEFISGLKEFGIDIELETEVQIANEVFKRMTNGGLEELKLALQKTSSSQCEARLGSDKLSLLHHAVVIGDIASFRHILDVKCVPIDDTSKNGLTPLHCACRGGHGRWHLYC